MSRFAIIRGSSRPPLEITLQESDGGPIDLTTATAARIVVAARTETATIDLVINLPMTLVLPLTAGQLIREWLSADTIAIVAGNYRGQVEVDFPSGPTAKWGTIDFIVLPSVEQ
jgi:hypothetical protein